MWDDVCGWARPRLALLAGGELAGADRRKVERHLIVCADCRSRLASLRESLGALHRLASHPPLSADAPSLWPALARQLREERRPASTASLWTRPAPWIGLSLAASVLVATASSSWLASHPSRRSPATVADSRPSPAPAAPASHRASRAVSEVNYTADAPVPRRPEPESLAQAPNPNPGRHGHGNGNGNGNHAPSAPPAGVRPPAEPTH